METLFNHILVPVDFTEKNQAAITAAEQIMIQSALRFTSGRRQEAAKLLGYGRNTLTRKIKELDLDQEQRESDEHLSEKPVEIQVD